MADPQWPALFHGSDWDQIVDALKGAWQQYHQGSVEARKRSLPNEINELRDANARGAKRLAQGKDPHGADTPPPEPINSEAIPNSSSGNKNICDYKLLTRVFLLWRNGY